MTPAAITPAARKQAARNGTPKQNGQTTARQAQSGRPASVGPAGPASGPHRERGQDRLAAAHAERDARAPPRPRLRQVEARGRVEPTAPCLWPGGGAPRRRGRHKRRHDRRPRCSRDAASPEAPVACAAGIRAAAHGAPGDAAALGGRARGPGARVRPRPSGPSAAGPHHPRPRVDPHAWSDARRDRRDAGRGAEARREHGPLDSAQLHAAGTQRGAAGERRLAD